MRRLAAGLLPLLITLLAALPSGARTRAHYTIILPPEYVGWVQVIFNDPTAPPLRHNPYTGGYYITVPESGIVRTRDLHLYAPDTATSLFYWTPQTYPFANLPVPASQHLPAASLGGFGTADTGDRGGQGYSWFFFIGPASMRAHIPHADFEHDAAQWHLQHGNYRVAFDGKYPTPGRLASASAASLH
jgi:hypothetical protein